MSERKIRSMLVGPNVEIKEEISPENPFGANVETPITRIMPRLHVHKNDKGIHVFLQNPVSGGPVAIASEEAGIDQLVIPGEPLTVEAKKATLFVKVCGYIQMIFIE